MRFTKKSRNSASSQPLVLNIKTLSENLERLTIRKNCPWKKLRLLAKDTVNSAFNLLCSPALAKLNWSQMENSSLIQCRKVSLEYKQNGWKVALGSQTNSSHQSAYLFHLSLFFCFLPSFIYVFQLFSPALLFLSSLSSPFPPSLNPHLVKFYS